MIQSRAMLANLSISQWTARKYDKSVSSEVEKAHAAHDAGLDRQGRSAAPVHSLYGLHGGHAQVP